MTYILGRYVYYQFTKRSKNQNLLYVLYLLYSLAIKLQQDRFKQYYSISKRIRSLFLKLSQTYFASKHTIKNRKIKQIKQKTLKCYLFTTNYIQLITVNETLIIIFLG